MGLDGVELVMAFEEEFGIEISDADAAHMMTPRHVIDHISLLIHIDQRRCTSRAGFYQFRRACMLVMGVPRNQIRPDTKLVSLLPPTDVQLTWARLGQAMQMSDHYWPSLEYPLPINRLRTAVFWLLISITTTLTCAAVGLLAGSLVLIASIRLSSWLDDLLAKHYDAEKVLLPPRLGTVTDLIDDLIPKEWVKAKGIISKWDRERIARKVKAIVIEQLGIDETQYHEDARFIEDFGVG